MPARIAYRVAIQGDEDFWPSEYGRLNVGFSGCGPPTSGVFFHIHVSNTSSPGNAGTSRNMNLQLFLEFFFFIFTLNYHCTIASASPNTDPFIPTCPLEQNTTPFFKDYITMPLVTPQSDGSKNEEWQNKLVGKSLSDENSNETCFCAKDLPEKHRIIKPGSIVTKDFRIDRLNVHVDDEGICTHVTHG
ncbi:hypothetical protein N3K66_005865 [Trichothecium roseum]|uniref:Uncharacterized protein n=1 Tax=Trichothecium roseum TaxID=47278 RepID=A0ACC0V0G6_9HYPO|nr:hypothetical protein N3K66_005865 [Trichothecium roseum]